MPLRRYSRSPVVQGGKALGTGRASAAIYSAVKRGILPVTRRTIKSGERLDIIAGSVYGDASLWWVIAAASGIGWGLQVPAGVVISIPTDLNTVELLVG